MEIQRIDIHEATYQQLATFAKVALGLDIQTGGANKMTGDQIIAVMRQAGYGMDHINLSAPAEPVSVTQQNYASEVYVFDGTDKYGLNRVRRLINITIPNQDKPGGSEEVPIGINGSHMYVKRNTPSLVPEEYVESLEHAIETRYIPNTDPVSLEPFADRRDVMRYPMSVIPIDANQSMLHPKTGKPYKIADRTLYERYLEAFAAKDLETSDRNKKRLQQQGLVA